MNEGQHGSILFPFDLLIFISLIDDLPPMKSSLHFEFETCRLLLFILPPLL